MRKEIPSSRFRKLANQLRHLIPLILTAVVILAVFQNCSYFEPAPDNQATIKR